MEKKLAGELDLALRQHFHRYPLQFFENPICGINLLFNDRGPRRGLKLSHNGIFDMLFPFPAFFK